MSEDRNPQLDELTAKIQEFINSVSDTPRFLQDAVVVFETVRYDEEGNATRETEYAIVTETTTMGAANGLADMAHRYISRDLNAYRWPGDDDA